jgi:O-antigen ligase
MSITILNIEFHLFELPVLVLLLCSFLLVMINDGLVIKLSDSKPLKLYVIGFLLFLVAIIISSLFATRPDLTVKALLKWLEVLVLSLLVFFNIRNTKSFNRIYWLLFFSMFGYTLLSVYSLFKGKLMEFGFRLPGGYDSLFAFSMIIPFLKKKSVIHILIAIFLVLNVFFSFSRGAWLGLILLLFYAIKHFYKINKNKTIIAVVLVSILLIMVSSESIKALIDWRWSTSFDAENASNIERSGLIRVAIEAFLSSPFFGIGALNYPTFLMHTSDLYIMRAEVLETLTPHNFFLEILCELGLLGFVALLTFFYAVYLASISRTINRNSFSDVYCKEGLFLLFFIYLYSISLGFISGGYRFYMALFFGMALSQTKSGEVS